jgi:diacylglycerol O-acyltransferase
MQRLSPLDVTFLHVEDDVSHMNIGLVGLFEGPAPAHGELRECIERAFEGAPRYRQRVLGIPFEAGRPVWHDDPHFSLAYHLRRTALPAPGGHAELNALVGRVMSQQLDRARPLWELWAVERVAGGRWALIAKFHHAMVDGISGSSLIGALLDAERDPPRRAAPPWTAAPEPAAPAMLAAALSDRAAQSLGELRVAVSGLLRPRRLAGRALDTARGLAGFGGLLQPPAASALNGPLGPHREWAFARASLVDVREIRAAHEDHPSVNDVVLAAVAGGLRALLTAAGEPVDSVRTMVPVSVRAGGDELVPDNRVSAMFADLPLAIEDPNERLHAVAAEMRRLKASHEADAGQVLTSAGELAPEIALALGGRIATRLPQRGVGTVTTNVPGPQRPLFLAGRRMLEALPYVPLGGHVRLGTAIYSYDGTIAFGVTGDADAPLRALDLCKGIEAAMAELLASARTAPRRRGDGRAVSAGRTARAR